MKLILLLTLALALGASSAHAAPARHLQAAPVVATWFSNLHPASGGRETLYVQFFQGKRALAGGRLSATVRYGEHAMHLTGGVTNAHGMASASFTIPRGLKGKVLKAVTSVMFKGQRYLGSNHVRVVA